jgi:hypothetical protein
MARRRTLGEADLRALALAMPEAREASHMEHADFRVRDKIFATLQPDGRIANFRVSPANLEALVVSDPETFRKAWGGNYLAVDLSRVSLEALRAVVADAWCLTASKAQVDAYRQSIEKGS